MSQEQISNSKPEELRSSNAGKMSPGIVHFDVSQGCTADLLNGALLDLGLPVEAVFHAFKQVGLKHVIPSHSSESAGLMIGSALELVHESGQSLASPIKQKPDRVNNNRKNPKKHSLRWDHQPTETEQVLLLENLEESPEDGLEPDIINTWFRNESGSLEDLILHVRASDLPPISSALTQKTLELLRVSLEKAYSNPAASQNLEGRHLLQILGQVVSFCVLIQSLNPLEVTASRIPLSWAPASRQNYTSNLDERSWMLALLEEMPTYEQEWPAAFSDPVAVALLRSIASRFGARGESRLLQCGNGVSKNLKEVSQLARALWCEPLLIATRGVEGPSAVPVAKPTQQIWCSIGANVDMPGLMRRLASFGARSIETSQVMEQGIRPKTSLSLIASHSDIEKIIEALLVTGEATEVSTALSERYGLSSRNVCVPFGRKQKKLECGVTEWLWGTKILRAEPVPADLASLVAVTGFAQDSVRSDVLASWRKWRRTEV